MKSIKKCNSIITILVLFTLCLPSLAQTPAKERFRTVNNENEYYIEFIDTITKQVKKTFDLRKNNPYNNLPFSKKGVSSNGYNEYQFDNIKLKDVDLKVANFVKNMSFDDDYIIDNATGISSDVVLANNYSSNYVIVKYNFFLTEGTSLLGQSSVVHVYTAEGALFKQIYAFTTQCQNLCITEDGQFIAYTYGGIADEGFERFDTIGYQIMDVQTENVIIDESFIHPVCETLMGCFGNLIMAACDKLNVITFIVYDFENKKKYTKDYPVSVLGKRRGITDFGFSFEVESNGTNVIRTDYYETDFKVEEIK